MSLASWKKRYYPKCAACVGPSDALDHSIKKWTGLLPGALTRHGVQINQDGTLCAPDGEMAIDASDCALCANFLAHHGGSLECKRCPLFWYLGQSCGKHGQPYLAWRNDHDPKPMIAALKAARRMVRAVVRR